MQSIGLRQEWEQLEYVNGKERWADDLSRDDMRVLLSITRRLFLDSCAGL